jgi:hypothetical protein
MLQLQQGKPASPYFLVFVPGTQPVETGETVECKHPVTGVVTTGICEFILREPWTRIPDWVCCCAYGMNSAQIKPALDKRFAEFAKTTDVVVLVIRGNNEK